ncbi:MAG: ATP synthase subunit I [Clostridia bacterium]|nr:ATP synthase subunit I [Clostridia bacterium]
MLKVDKTVKKETTYIAISSVIMSLFMQSVFLILGFWDYTVLLGNLWGVFAAVLNFFLMGITVQKALNKDKKQAQSMVRASQAGRMFMLFCFVLVGVLVDAFNIYAVLISLLFPRIWIFMRPLLDKKSDDKG